MVYIFRQYMYLLFINCHEKFAILWEFYFILTLLFFVVHNIWVDIINGRHFWWIYFQDNTCLSFTFVCFILYNENGT